MKPMNDRERLVELLKGIYADGTRVNEDRTVYDPMYEKHIADYLISHDVTFGRHGRWEEWWPDICLIMTGEEMLYRCSACDAKYADIEGKNYCPNCGAEMDGEA